MYFHSELEKNSSTKIFQVIGGQIRNGQLLVHLPYLKQCETKWNNVKK